MACARGSGARRAAVGAASHLLELEKVSAHAFRCSRRRAAINRTNEKMVDLQRKLLDAEREIRAWRTWWGSWQDGQWWHGWSVAAKQQEMVDVPQRELPVVEVPFAGVVEQEKEVVVRVPGQDNRVTEAGRLATEGCLGAAEDVEDLIDDLRWEAQQGDEGQRAIVLEPVQEDREDEEEEESADWAESDAMTDLEAGAEVYGGVDAAEMRLALAVEADLLQEGENENLRVHKNARVLVKLGRMLLKALRACGARMDTLKMVRAVVLTMGPEFSYILRGDCWSDAAAGEWCESYVKMLLENAAKALDFALPGD